MIDKSAGWPDEVTRYATQLREQLRWQADQFISDHELPESFSHLIDNYYLPLAAWLAHKRRADCTLVVGICGGQGSGKSALADFLRLGWRQMGLRSAGFSLDDIYLTRAERRQLARQIHPLFETRGVPGTHDVQLGLDTITALREAESRSETPIPLFDKSTDDRAPRGNWPRQRGPVDILLFEGWCLGSKPWKNAAAPINTLERQEDPEGIWRNYINEQLAGPYRALFSDIDVLLMLKVPDMACALEWRRLQERKLRARSGGGMSDEELERFVQHYERITRNSLAEMPQRADCVFELGRDHQICAMRLNG